MKNILFVSYGGGHINIINLIAKKLIEDSECNFKILALTTAYNTVYNEYPSGIVKKISDYKDLFVKDTEKIEKYGNMLLDENYNPNGIVSKEDTIYYLGLSMLDLVKTHTYDKAIELYNKSKRQAFSPVSIMKKILEYENVDSVFTTTSPRFEEASILAAKFLGIKSIQILDLFAEVYPLPNADYIICMNQDIKDDLIKLGHMQNKIFPLGQPSIEKSVNSIMNIDKKELRKRINIPKKITLLFATQRLVKVSKEFKILHNISYEKVYDRLFHKLSLLNEMYDINIAVRVHPNENIEDYRKYFNKYKFLIFLNDKCTFEESIVLSDIVLVKTSTVGVEAMACNKQVFTYMHEFDDYYTVPRYTKDPFIFSIGIEQLYQNLCEYLDNIKQIEKKKNFLPNNSSVNIAKLIKDL